MCADTTVMEQPRIFKLYGSWTAQWVIDDMLRDHGKLNPVLPKLTEDVKVVPVEDLFQTRLTIISAPAISIMTQENSFELF